MCDTCLRSPCHPQCPNAPEPPTVCVCDKCSEPVRAGDVYYEEPGGEILCQGCIEEMDTHALLCHLGCSGKVAEVA